MARNRPTWPRFSICSSAESMLRRTPPFSVKRLPTALRKPLRSDRRKSVIVTLSSCCVSGTSLATSSPKGPAPLPTITLGRGCTSPTVTLQPAAPASISASATPPTHARTFLMTLPILPSEPELHVRPVRTERVVCAAADLLHGHAVRRVSHRHAGHRAVRAEARVAAPFGADEAGRVQERRRGAHVAAERGAHADLREGVAGEARAPRPHRALRPEGDPHV